MFDIEWEADEIRWEVDEADPELRHARIGDKVYHLQRESDGRIRLFGDLLDWPRPFWTAWGDAFREAPVVLMCEIERAELMRNPAWLLHCELKRRGRDWSYPRSARSWAGRYFCWYSERHSKEENLAMYKIVAGLPKESTVEDVAMAIDRPMNDSYPKQRKQ